MTDINDMPPEAASVWAWALRTGHQFFFMTNARNLHGAMDLCHLGLMRRKYEGEPGERFEVTPEGHRLQMLARDRAA